MFLCYHIQNKMTHKRAGRTLLLQLFRNQYFHQYSICGRVRTCNLLPFTLLSHCRLAKICRKESFFVAFVTFVIVVINAVFAVVFIVAVVFVVAVVFFVAGVAVFVDLIFYNNSLE